MASPGGRVAEIKVRERRVPSYEKDKEMQGRPDGKAYRERVMARLLGAYADSKGTWLWNELDISTTGLLLLFCAVTALLANSVVEALVLAHSAEVGITRRQIDASEARSARALRACRACM